MNARPKHLMWILSGVMLISCSCARKPAPKPRLGFITQLGEHTIVPDLLTLNLWEEGTGIKYRFHRKNNTPECTTGPTSASIKMNGIPLTLTECTTGFESATIKSDSDWFAFVESAERVWIYDGKGDLALWSFAKELNGVYSLKVCGEWLRKEVPPAVIARIPEVVTTQPATQATSRPHRPVAPRHRAKLQPSPRRRRER